VAVEQSRAWEDYRRRRRLFLIAWLGYLPGAGLIGFLLAQVFQNDSAFVAVALCWMVFFAISAEWLRRFPCPNCGKAFFHTWLWNNPFAKKCLHCGWPKWAAVPLPFEARQPDRPMSGTAGPTRSS